MIKSFKDLIVWQKSHLLVLKIYKLTMSYPKNEMYCLVSQMRRAIISVAVNIVEGYKRKTCTDFKHFVNISETSLEELKYYCLLSFDLRYIEKSVYEELEKELGEIGAMLNGLKKSLERRTK